MSVFIGLVIGFFWLGAFHNAPVVGALLGALCGWVYKLNARIKTLETNQQDLMQALQAIQGHGGAGADTADDRAAASVEQESHAPDLQQNEPHPQQVELSLVPVPEAESLAATTEQLPEADNLSRTTSPDPTSSSHTPVVEHPPSGVSSAAAEEEPEPDLLTRGFSAAKDWLLGGNPFVRAGIVLLFIGFVFLMRYSLENNLIPVEVRLLGSALAALALLGFGWKFRGRAGAYGLILQAGA